jgi:hypothetical protein
MAKKAIIAAGGWIVPILPNLAIALIWRGDFGIRLRAVEIELYTVVAALMELLLNLIWLTIAAGGLLAFMRSRSRSARMAHVPYSQALIALACVVVLLFPVISASDDLHPAQEVVEDASKKLQLAIAPLHLQRTSPSSCLSAVMVAIGLTFALIVLRPVRSPVPPAQMLDGAIVASAGRAPPLSR